MTKPFNIHDWQFNQRLNEEDEFQKRQDALTPGKNPDAFFGDDSLMNRKRADWKAPPMGMSPGESDNDQDLLVTLRNQIEQGTLDSKMQDKFVELLDNLIDKEDENNNRNLAQDDARDYNSERDFLPLQEHTVTFTKDDMATLHNDGELVKADDDGKDHTYIFNELDEQNTVGTGASFSPGNSPAYATPKAFGKKKDKDIEVFGYKKVKK